MTPGVEGLSYWLVENSAPDPRSWFQISDDLVRHYFANEDVVGIWHTHPPGFPEPSKADFLHLPRSVDIFVVCEGLRRWTSTKHGSGWTEKKEW